MVRTQLSHSNHIETKKSNLWTYFQRGIFLAFSLAKESIISSKLTALVRSFSMLITAKSASFCCPRRERRWFLMSLSLLKDHSALATVTGKVKKIRREMVRYGKSCSNFFSMIWFKSIRGVWVSFDQNLQCVSTSMIWSSQEAHLCQHLSKNLQSCHTFQSTLNYQALCTSKEMRRMM